MIIRSYEIQKNPSKFIHHNLFLLYGENNGLKKDIQESIKLILDKKTKNSEVLSFFENDIMDNTEVLYNSIFSGSLFSEEKIITINYCTDKIIKQIKNIVDKKPKNICLIIFADVLEKKSKLRNFFEKYDQAVCVPCYPDNDKDMAIIASNELRKSNIILSRVSLNLLIEKSNNDRNNLKNEIEKIKLFSLNKKQLDIEDIQNIINFSGEYKSDSFVNECLCGNIIQYRKILSELYTNTINQIFLLRILSNKIHRLLKLKEQQNDHINIDSLLNETRPPIFWKEKTMVKKQLTIWNLSNLKKTVGEINETELLCKKNPQSAKIIFYNFFTKVCKQANNYS